MQKCPKCKQYHNGLGPGLCQQCFIGGVLYG